MADVKIPQRPELVTVKEAYEQMQAHFSQTRIHSGERVARLLGDPVKSIGLRESSQRRDVADPAK